MRTLGLNTVCESARCPNMGECWEHRTATFMILAISARAPAALCGAFGQARCAPGRAGARARKPKRHNSWACAMR